MVDEGQRKIGWGLIGPGRFAREFVEELVKIDRVNPVAVASRSVAKAEAFAREFGFARSYDTYEALVKDPEVDIVYVVVPHVFHAEVSRLALKAGKAVLCEKPLTESLSATRELVEEAREKKVFLMEAMKTGFLPVISHVRNLIQSGAIGEPRLLRADFCFNGPVDPEDRLMNPDLGGGAVLDVGIYPIYLAQLLLGKVMELSAEAFIGSTGVEETVAISMKHEGGAVSSLTCSFRSVESMDAHLLGSDGSIEIPRFHAATEATIRSGDRPEYVFQPQESGMVRAEIEAVMDALESCQTECPGHDLDDSLELARLMDEVLGKIGR